jgi:hypothetical protein
MAYLGGPGRGVRRPRLHDAPPGYRPPRLPRGEQRRQLRQDYILLRVATVIAVGLVIALVVVGLIVIATHV